VGVVLTLSSAILCGLVWFVFAGGGIGTVDYPPLHNTITWVAIVSLLTWCLAIIGWGTIGRPTGVIIDTRNQMSLSRLQAAAWTILVVSAILTMAMSNIREGAATFWEGTKERLAAREQAASTEDTQEEGLEPAGTEDAQEPGIAKQRKGFEAISGALEIEVPVEVWSLLGISTASLAAAGLIKSQKKNDPPNEDNKEVVNKQFEEEKDKADANLELQGTSVGNASPDEAKLRDMFTGDEVGSANSVELGKVQMLIFTVIVLFVYAVMLVGTFWVAEDLKSLPVLTGGIVTFLAISHAGYLTNKVIPNIPSGATPKGTPEDTSGGTPEGTSKGTPRGY